jgi:hypothetical protein
MCIRQHEVAADVLRIGDVIHTIGKVAAVLDPWDKPLCLERVWCLYEIAQTVSAEAESTQQRYRRGSAFVSMRRPNDGEQPVRLRRTITETVTETAPPQAALPQLQLPASASLQAATPSDVGVSSRSASRCKDSAELESARTPSQGLEGTEPRSAHGRRRHVPPEEKPVQLFLTMSKSERLKLAHAARTSRSQIERALTRFDCRTAGASVEADRQMILSFIAEMFAVDEPPRRDELRASKPAAASIGSESPTRVRRLKQWKGSATASPTASPTGWSLVRQGALNELAAGADGVAPSRALDSVETPVEAPLAEVTRDRLQPFVGDAKYWHGSPWPRVRTGASRTATAPARSQPRRRHRCARRSPSGTSPVLRPPRPSSRAPTSTAWPLRSASTPTRSRPPRVSAPTPASTSASGWRSARRSRRSRTSTWATDRSRWLFI